VAEHGSSAVTELAALGAQSVGGGRTVGADQKSGCLITTHNTDDARMQGGGGLFLPCLALLLVASAPSPLATASAARARTLALVAAAAAAALCQAPHEANDLVVLAEMRTVESSRALRTNLLIEFGQTLATEVHTHTHTHTRTQRQTTEKSEWHQDREVNEESNGYLLKERNL